MASGNLFAIYRLACHVERLWRDHLNSSNQPYPEFFRTREVYTKAAQVLQSLSGCDVHMGKMDLTSQRHACGEFVLGERVRYVPNHANDDEHPACETGTVSSHNGTFVFVRFDRQIAVVGFDGATSQACDPARLQKLK